MKRIWHNYLKWEEYHSGMWRTIQNKYDRMRMISQAVLFTGDADMYGKAMIRCITE